MKILKKRLIHDIFLPGTRRIKKLIFQTILSNDSLVSCHPLPFSFLSLIFLWFVPSCNPFEMLAVYSVQIILVG